MYFKKFDKIPYAIDGYNKNVVNILKAVLPKLDKINKTFVFQTYLVQSGQLPESVAYELYADANYHWTILVINNIVNPYTDWSMSDEEVELLTAKKYGEIYGLHHFYWLDSGKRLDEVDDATYRALYPELPENVIPVTNLQHETEINQNKRQITVVNPRYITQFIEAFNKALEGKE